MFIQFTKANKYKAESYSLFLEIARCREELMTARIVINLKMEKKERKL